MTPRLTSAGFTALYRLAMHDGTVPTAPRPTVRKLINDGLITCTDTTDAGHIYTVTDTGRDALDAHVDRIKAGRTRVYSADEAAIADNPTEWTARIFVTRFIPAVINYANDHYRDGRWAEVIDTLDRPTLAAILANARPRVFTDNDAVDAIAAHLGHPNPTIAEPLTDTLTGADYTVHPEGPSTEGRSVTGLVMANPSADHAVLYDVEDGNLYTGPNADVRRLMLAATLTRTGWNATDNGTSVAVTGPAPLRGLEPSSAQNRDARRAAGALAARGVALATLAEDYNAYDIGPNADATGAFVTADGTALTITHIVNGHDTDPHTGDRWHTELDHIADALIEAGYNVSRQRRDTVSARPIDAALTPAPGRYGDSHGHPAADRAAATLAAHAVPLADTTAHRADGALIEATGETTVVITHLAGGWADPHHGGAETVGALSAHGWAITRNNRGVVHAQMPETASGQWNNRAGTDTGGHRVGRDMSTDADPAVLAAVATLDRAGFAPATVVGGYRLRETRFIGNGFVVVRPGGTGAAIAPVVIVHMVDGRVLDDSPQLRHYARTLNAHGWDAAHHPNRVIATPVKGANPYKASDAQLDALALAAATATRTVPDEVHGKVTAGLATRGWITHDPAFGAPVLNGLGYDVLKGAYPSLAGAPDVRMDRDALTGRLARLAQWRVDARVTAQGEAAEAAGPFPVRVEQFTDTGRCQDRDGNRHQVPHLTHYRVTVGDAVIEGHDPDRIAQAADEALSAVGA